ncbi:hypothetical protein [Streptomyces rhizosphaerihabitans]|uniref:hypothetical protein n=1 Tax=Streptomyces rhizosphaerihabitans TaxID=1266770 RepID=UPI0021BE8971|nr:hypothetical protein [Streptomyces rhizosphaerihabitans]MCT9010311.1 hypothetical protein [Streptomyces rhizosphaerihabitans]
MRNGDRRQDSSADSHENTINGGTYVGPIIQNIANPRSFQSQDAEPAAARTVELLLRIEALLQERRTTLVAPEAAAMELHRLWAELQEAEPQPNVVRRALDRLQGLLSPVPDLGPAVHELASMVHRLLNGDYFDPHLSQLLRQSKPPAGDSLDGGKPANKVSGPEAAPLPITIYLSDEAPHRDVEAAVEELLATAGLTVLDRDDPVIGSWFRRMRATMSRAARSQVVRESALTAAHIADTRLILGQDATITATMMQNVGPVLTSLQPTKDAVVRIGAILIVKVDWEVRVLQLTAAQQAILDHQPQLATSPRDVIGAIGLLTASDGRAAPEPAPQAAGDR